MNSDPLFCPKSFSQRCWDLKTFEAPNVDVATQPTVVLDGAAMSSESKSSSPQLVAL